DFLAPESNQFLLQSSLESQEKFEASRILSKEKNWGIDYSHRDSLSLMQPLNEMLFFLLKGKIHDLKDQLIERFGCKFHSWDEEFLFHTNVLNDKHFFSPHCDNEPNDPDSRETATFVYFYSKVPQQFTGGELCIWDTYFDSETNEIKEQLCRECLEIQPINNRAVMFHGDCLHEVLPVKCPSQDFADSRFSITIRII
ncbi:MAG: 2OG-Fe(II) oxygenase, partial [Symploca sp. SIO1B1]|nr:2OG-Fe(II) oxygenase [Symploca sp. SIO1B1]